MKSWNLCTKTSMWNSRACPWCWQTWKQSGQTRIQLSHDHCAMEYQYIISVSDVLEFVFKTVMKLKSISKLSSESYHAVISIKNSTSIFQLSPSCVEYFYNLTLLCDMYGIAPKCMFGPSSTCLQGCKPSCLDQINVPAMQLIISS